jgi:large subunit ribosomal protein L6
MSRIGMKPIELPAGVEIKVDGNVVSVKGPKGQLQQEISPLITVNNDGGTLTLTRDGDETEKRSQHGLARTLINNMVVGVTEGFEKKLVLIGVGYKAEKKGKKLVMNLGYSHPVEMEDPEGITTETPDANTILVKGIDKAQVGNYAANIRAWRKPEPYKGKGIRYDGEYVRRKEGKTGAAATGA